VSIIIFSVNDSFGRALTSGCFSWISFLSLFLCCILFNDKPETFVFFETEFNTGNSFFTELDSGVASSLDVSIFLVIIELSS